MTLTIHEAVKRINQGGKGNSQRQVAKDYGKSESTLRGHIKEAGYVRNEEKKYILTAEKEVSAETSFSQDELTAETNFSSNEVSAETNETTNEEKNSRANEGIRVKINEAPPKANKEGKTAMRKRASFDINEELLERLRIYAILAKKNAYEIVEIAIKEYMDKQKGFNENMDKLKGK